MRINLQLSQLSPEISVEVISGTPLIKAVTNFKQVCSDRFQALALACIHLPNSPPPPHLQMGRSMEEFEVRERSAAYLSQLWPNVSVHNSPAVSFDPKIKVYIYISYIVKVIANILHLKLKSHMVVTYYWRNDIQDNSSDFAHGTNISLLTTLALTFLLLYACVQYCFCLRVSHSLCTHIRL